MNQIPENSQAHSPKLRIQSGKTKKTQEQEGVDHHEHGQHSPVEKYNKITSGAEAMIGRTLVCSASIHMSNEVKQALNKLFEVEPKVVDHIELSLTDGHLALRASPELKTKEILFSEAIDTLTQSVERYSHANHDKIFGSFEIEGSNYKVFITPPERTRHSTRFEFTKKGDDCKYLTLELPQTYDEAAKQSLDNGVDFDPMGVTPHSLKLSFSSSLKGDRQDSLLTKDSYHLTMGYSKDQELKIYPNNPFIESLRFGSRLSEREIEFLEFVKQITGLEEIIENHEPVIPLGRRHETLS